MRSTVEKPIEHKGWIPMVANKKRLKDGMQRLYEAIAIEAREPKVSHLPKDWRNRIFKGA